MKTNVLTSVFTGIMAFSLWAQQDTEVFLTDIKTINGKLTFGSSQKVSNNEGYHNQPSFYDNDRLLFASTRENQTDIAQYDNETKEVKWFTNTKNGSEYSPTKIPSATSFSSIRLDTDGLQRLYTYPLDGGNSKILVEDAKIGYHVWYSKTILVATVLIENRMDLVAFDLEKKTNQVLYKNVGRSLHLIPKTDLVSFITVANDSLVVTSIHPNTGVQETLVTLPQGTQDICWLADGSILTGLKNYLLRFNPETDTQWKDIFQFSDTDIYEISRLAVSPDGKKLAFVTDISPPKLIDRQMKDFSRKDLTAFTSYFADDVVVSNFPNETRYIGKDNLRNYYKEFYARIQKVEAKALDRIYLKNTVIDHEQVIMDDITKLQAVIYQFKDNKIMSMSFIPKTDSKEAESEKIVQRQLDAYNARDIEAFLATYTKEIEIHNYGGEMRYKGLDTLREGYTRLFESTPDLHCEIENRIVLGNKVIDHEQVTANGNTFSVIAIYEVEDEKIAKVTFVR